MYIHRTHLLAALLCVCTSPYLTAQDIGTQTSKATPNGGILPDNRIMAGASLDPGGGSRYLQTARGLQAEATTSSEALDSINAFNGNLGVAIPLGSRRAVGAIEYGLTAIYNSNTWDYVYRCYPSIGCFNHSVPAMSSNSGLGWTVSLGELFEPLSEVSAPFYAWPNATNQEYLYLAPDGSRHLLKCVAAWQPGGSCTVRYDTNGGWLRLVTVSATEKRLELPNGQKHTFKLTASPSCWYEGTCWKLSSIRDQMGNSIDLTYFSGYTTITEKPVTGTHRTHRIEYNIDPGDAQTSRQLGRYSYYVSRVTFHFGTAAAQAFAFVYDTAVVNREWPHYACDLLPGGCPFEDDGVRMSVPRLRRIDTPAGGRSYFFAYNDFVNLANTIRASGSLQSYTIPTGATISYKYGLYRFPRPCSVSSIGYAAGIPIGEDPFWTTVAGIASRTVTGPNLTSSRTNYVQTLDSTAPSNSPCARPKMAKVTIYGPGVASGDNEIIGEFPAQDTWYSVTPFDQGLWLARQFGLATRRETGQFVTDSDGKKLYLSSASYICASGNCVVQDLHYLHYADVLSPASCLPWDSSDCSRMGTVVDRHRVVHSQDADSYTGVWLSDYDGLGNWRSEKRYASTTYSGAASPPLITREVNAFVTSGDIAYTGDTITLTASFGERLRSRSNWQIGSVTKSTQSDGVHANSVVSSCLDTFGRLKSVLVSAGADGRGTTYTYTTAGIATSNQQTTGYASSIAADCSMTLSNAVASTQTFNDSGAPEKRYFDGLQTDFDSLTEWDDRGYPKAATDASGLKINKTFDAIGRPLFVEMSNSGRIATGYSYPDNNTTVVARGDATITFKYDALGRLVSQEESLPPLDGSTNRKSVTTFAYDARGNRTAITSSQDNVWSASYDGLDRIKSSQTAEGKAIDYSYLGDRVRIRTYRTSGYVEKDYLDLRGLVVKEERGATSLVASPMLCALYEYDNSGRVVSQKRGRGDCQGLQTRTYEYNGAGLLTKSTFPEKGSFTYSEFDGFGNPRLTATPEFQLRTEYDGKGRPTVTTDASTHDVLVERVYGGVGCTNGTYCRGRLQSVVRHNRFGAEDFTVATTYTYADGGARPSGASTAVQYPAADGSKATETFSQSLSVDSLGNLASVQYPVAATSSGGAPSRSVVMGNIFGRLNSVSSDVAPSMNVAIGYNLAGLPVRYDFGSERTVLAYKGLNSAGGTVLDSISVFKDGTSLFSMGPYKYDDRANITALSSSELQGPTFTYDAVNRLTKSVTTVDGLAANESMTYDSFDNIVRRETRNGGQDRVVEFSPSTSSNRIEASGYSYDRNGRLTSNGCLTFEYDQLDGLKAVTSVDPSRPGCQLKARHLYDGSGLRVLTMCDAGCDFAPPGPAFTLSVDKDQIYQGASVILNWTAAPTATSCVASGAWSGSKSPSGGTETFVPTQPLSTYSLQCTNGSQSTTRSVSVTIKAPSLSITANPQVVLASGGTIRLDWFVNGATSCTASGNWSGAKSATGGGEHVVAPSSSPGTTLAYVLACSSVGGTETKTATVTVQDHLPLPYACYVVPAVVQPDQPATLQLRCPVQSTDFEELYVEPNSAEYRIEWFRVRSSGAGIGTERLSDITSQISGSSTSRLRVTAASPSREASYYATLTTLGASPQTLVSEPGQLSLRTGTVVGEFLDVSFNGYWSTCKSVGLSKNYVLPIFVFSPDRDINGMLVRDVHLPTVHGFSGKDYARVCLRINELQQNQQPFSRVIHVLVMEAGSWRLSNGAVLNAFESKYVGLPADPKILYANPLSEPNTVAIVGQSDRRVYPEGYFQLADFTTGSRLFKIGAQGLQVVHQVREGSSQSHGVVLPSAIFGNPLSGFIETGKLSSARLPVRDWDQWAAGIPAFSDRPPVFVAALSTYNDPDPGELNYRVTSSGAVEFRFVEDPYPTRIDGTPDEGNHGQEGVAFIATEAVGPFTGVRNGAACSAPSISVQPTSRNVQAGANVILDAAVNGTEAIQFEWKKNGAVIQQGYSSGLSLSNVSSAHVGSYVLTARNPCGVVLSQAATIQIVGPDGGPHQVLSVPGRIQVEDYNDGGQNVGYFDTTTGNSTGHYRSDDVDVDLSNFNDYIVVTAAGEWLNYTVNVDSPGTYELDIRHANPNGPRQVQLRVDGGALSSVSLLRTGAWGNWMVDTVGSLSFSTAGSHVVKVLFPEGSMNVDWFELRPSPGVSSVLVSDSLDSGAGAPLAGRISEVGARSWAGSSNWQVAAGGWAELTSTVSPMAVLPFTASEASSSAMTELEVQISPLGTEWVGVGFSKDPTSGWWVGGQIWLLVRPSGVVNLLFNGTAVSATGELALPANAKFSASAFNQVRIRYRPAVRSVEIIVNGVQIGGAYALPSGFTPVLGTFGVTGLNISSLGAKIDALRLKRLQ